MIKSQQPNQKSGFFSAMSSKKHSSSSPSEDLSMLDLRQPDRSPADPTQLPITRRSEAKSENPELTDGSPVLPRPQRTSSATNGTSFVSIPRLDGKKKASRPAISLSHLSLDFDRLKSPLSRRIGRIEREINRTNGARKNSRSPIRPADGPWSFPHNFQSANEYRLERQCARIQPNTRGRGASPTALRRWRDGHARRLSPPSRPSLVLKPLKFLPRPARDIPINDEDGWSAKETWASEQQTSCRLFSKLPSELRIQIYENLLVSDDIIRPHQQLVGHTREYAIWRCPNKIIESAGDPWSVGDIVYEGGGYKPAAGLDASILRTCRALYLEAHEILYRYNTFHIENFLNSQRIPDR